MIRKGRTLSVADISTSLLTNLREDELGFISRMPSSELMPACAHLLATQGKQIRVQLLIASARLGPDPANHLVRQAAGAIELLHLASLAHDDIIDNGTIRRGSPTTGITFGQRTAGFAGAWVLGRAVETIAACGQDAVARFLKTTRDMCVGGLLELRDLWNPARSVEDYTSTSELKTASAMQLAAYLGAKLSGSSPQVVTLAETFGFELGMAWQIWDDLLDLLATPDENDKTPTSDLRNGVFTLPTIFALRESDELREILSEKAKPFERYADLVELIVRARGAEHAAQQAEDHANQAIATLKALPVRDELRTLLEFVREQHHEVIVRSFDQRATYEQSPSQPSIAPMIGEPFQSRPDESADAMQPATVPTIAETPLFLTINAVSKPGTERLIRIDRLSSSALDVPHLTRNDIAHRHLLAGDGPTVALVYVMANFLCKPDTNNEVIDPGLAYELIGVATKLFSRISNEIKTSASNQDNAVATLVADFVLSRSLEIAASYGTDSVAQLFRMARAVFEGAALDADDAWVIDRTTDRYLAAAAGHDGTLHAHAAALGARLAGATDAEDALHDYGHNLGVALRISNDVVSLLDGDHPTAREPGDDLRLGNYTLPVIYALEEDAGLAPLLAAEKIEDSLAQALERIRATRAVERCLAECSRFTDAARAALNRAGLRGSALDDLAGLAVELCAASLPGASESPAN